MKVKFNNSDPRRGTTADLPPDQAKAFIDAGAAVEVKGNAAATDESATLSTANIARKSAAKPAANKAAAKKAPAKKAAAKRASKAGAK